MGAPADPRAGFREADVRPVNVVFAANGDALEQLGRARDALAGRELTPEQLLVMTYIAQGKTVADVALLIEKKPGTVRQHMHRAEIRLGAETTWHAIYLLTKAGAIP